MARLDFRIVLVARYLASVFDVFTSAGVGDCRKLHRLRQSAILCHAGNQRRRPNPLDMDDIFLGTLRLILDRQHEVPEIHHGCLMETVWESTADHSTQTSFVR